MNNIKFRAWNPDLREMYEVKGYTNGKVLLDMPEPSIIDELNDIHLIKDIKLMQYIGRQDDETGTDLYESDIVIAVGEGGIAYIGFIDFKDCSFCITDNLSFTLYDLMDYEIFKVGNIYENEKLYEAITKDDNNEGATSASECEREVNDGISMDDKICKCRIDCPLICIDPCVLCFKGTCEQCEYGYKPLIKRLKIKYGEEQIKLYKSCKYVNKFFLNESKKY